MGKAKKRRRAEAEARAGATADAAADLPTALASYAHATAITGAKKVKRTCCRSTPRCKGCPVLLMRAARLQEAGLTGKDLQKAVKKARAA